MSNYDKIKRLLGEPIRNIAQSFYDDFVEANVKFRSRSGLKTFIIRQELAKCCKWCHGLAGIYNSDDAPKDIYRRHDSCRCVVTFKNEKGYTNVWNKKEFSSYSAARIDYMKSLESQLSMRAKIAKDTRKGALLSFEKKKEIFNNSLFQISNKTILFGDDKIMFSASLQIETEENNYINIFSHGDSTSIEITFNGEKAIFNAEEFAKLLKELYNEIDTIKLFVCSNGAGDNNFAKQLSKVLNNVVIAADGDVYYRDDLGVVFIGNNFRNNGNWKKYNKGKLEESE